MSRYYFTPEASADLFEIWSYVADDDPKAADRVEDAIHAACGLLADSPLIGSIRKELTDLPLRFWVVRPFRNYWIVYDPDVKPLQIIRILHAAREVPRLLR